MMEILSSHTNVVFQPRLRQPGYSGDQPVRAGSMFPDLRRICENLTAEDREWFPDIAATAKTLDYAMRHFKDEKYRPATR